jgi:hypothetical protein
MPRITNNRSTISATYHKLNIKLRKKDKGLGSTEIDLKKIRDSSTTPWQYPLHP